jgi:hypothetical protein
MAAGQATDRAEVRFDPSGLTMVLLPGKLLA